MPADTKPPDTVLWTRREVAYQLRVTERWVDKARARNGFPQPTLYLGRCPRWSRQVIADWIASQEAVK